MLKGFLVFFRKELREHWRTFRFLIIAVVFLIFGIISAPLAKYTPDIIKNTTPVNIQMVVPDPTINDALTQFLKNVGGTGLLAVILLTMGIVAREKGNGTAALVLTKPLTRQAFLLAKFAALVVLITVGMTIAGTTDYLYTALLFDLLSVPGFVIACLLIALTLLVYATITLLGSTLFRSQIAAGGVGIGALILFGLIAIIPKAATYTPGALLKLAQAFAVGDQPPDVWQAIVPALAIIVASLLAAWLSLRRQEL